MTTQVENIKVRSSVKKVTTCFGETGYKIVQKVFYGNEKKVRRVFTDCELFPTKIEALNAIPHLDVDLIVSIEKGVL